jgi:hypothetical protein
MSIDYIDLNAPKPSSHQLHPDFENFIAQEVDDEWTEEDAKNDCELTFELMMGLC